MKVIMFVLFVVLAGCLPDKSSPTLSSPAAVTDKPAEVIPVAAPTTGHIAPKLSEIPEGPFGDSVRRGAAIFFDTPANAANFAGNSQSCSNCHMGGGRIADSSPMWAAWGMYPAYRKKNNRVNTMEERLQGCFTFSQNAPASASGGAPPKGDAVLVDLQAYIFWLSKDVPIGKDMPGRGFPTPTKPATGYSVERGKVVFDAQCALCHGAEGQGLRTAEDHQQFPPLWGPESYNWGAGMHRVNTSAGFIKANMPLGKADLSDQEAWDVAAYINSKPRPKDPRQVGSLEDNDTKNHDEDCLYGDSHEGKTLGVGVSRAL